MILQNKGKITDVKYKNYNTTYLVVRNEVIKVIGLKYSEIFLSKRNKSTANWTKIRIIYASFFKR